MFTDFIGLSMYTYSLGIHRWSDFTTIMSTIATAYPEESNTLPKL